MKIAASIALIAALLPTLPALAGPTGACCTDLGCIDGATEVDCDFLAGTFLGPGTVCDASACSTGACCFPDGTCSDESGGACVASGGTPFGDGSTCLGIVCEAIVGTPIPLTPNWNGIVHAGEASAPDDPDGYRAIADRGFIAGDANSLGGPGGVLTTNLSYPLVNSAGVLDMIYIGGPRADGNGGTGFDTIVDTDNKGVAPIWDPSVGDSVVDAATSIITPIVIPDGFEMGVIFHSSSGGGTFDMTLGFSGGLEVTVQLSAPDWFANLNGVASPPAPGVASQLRLPGPLSAGDGFLGAAATDSGTLGSPLNIIEATVTSDSLASLGTSVVGEELISIRFDNARGGSEMTVGVYAAAYDVAAVGACCVDGACSTTTATGCTGAGGLYLGDEVSCDGVTCPIVEPLPLDYNWNGLVHFGDGGNADSPFGYRSIWDRGLSAGSASALGGATGEVSGALTYQLEMVNLLDTVYIGGPRSSGGVVGWDLVDDGDTIGIAPAWDPTGGTATIISATTVIAPVRIDDSFALGVIYNASVGGGDFDMTLGFESGLTRTVTLNAPDWFANFDGVAAPPGVGVASQQLLAGPLSGGDGFAAVSGIDLAVASSALNVTEAVVTYASLSTIGPIDGEVLSSITFDNVQSSDPSATVGVYGASVSTTDDESCFGDLDASGAVEFNDLLQVLANWGCKGCPEDLDGSGTADFNDVVAVLANWGSCP